MDRRSGWPCAKAVPKATAAQVALGLWEQIITVFGFPDTLTSDQRKIISRKSHDETISDVGY